MMSTRINGYDFKSTSFSVVTIMTFKNFIARIHY